MSKPLEHIKLVISHMDSMLSFIKDLIEKTDIDNRNKGDIDRNNCKCHELRSLLGRVESAAEQAKITEATIAKALLG